MKRFLLVSLALLCCFGCKLDSAKEDLRHFLKEQEPTVQIFKINSDSIVELEGEKGTILKIDPSVLRRQDGSPVKGEIEIHLLELTSKEDLLRANAQTVSDGKWLVSGGAYNIQIFSESEELKIVDGKSIEVNFPKIASEEMQLFDGNRDMEGNMNWELSNQVLKNRRYPAIIQKDSSFYRFNRPFQIDMVIDTLVFRRLDNNFTLNEFQQNYKEVDSVAIESDTIKGFVFRKFSELDSLWIVDNPEYGYLLKPKVTSLISDLYMSISVSKLGWINVDRFYPEITDRVSFQITSDIVMDYAQIYAADSENNTLLDLYQDGNGIIFFNAPLEKRFTIIAFGIKGEQVYGYKKSVLIEKDTEHQIKYRKADKKNMETYFKLD